MKWLLVLLFSLNAHATGREQMRGSSQSEREIRWVWKYVKEFSLSCLASKTECQDKEVRAVVSELAAYLPSYESAEWAGLLEFVSESAHPDLFSSATNEAHRVAVTQTKKFSTVSINADKMKRPLHEWVGLLIHETVHHLGYPDDATRLPDRVGAEITAHFQRNALAANLEQFQRPDFHRMVFNSEAGRLTVGMISWADHTFDVEWGPIDVMPFCHADEVVAGQFVGSPFFRVNRVRAELGRVTVRGGGSVNVACANRQTGAQRLVRMMIASQEELQYRAPLDLKNWINETPQIILESGEDGPSQNAADIVFGPNQTFWVVSLQHEKQSLSPADTWHAQIVVRSMDGYVPKTCDVSLSGTHWSFFRQHNLPASQKFSRCTLTASGGNQYRLEVETTFPANAQSDDFFIDLIRFPESAGDRFAVPVNISFVSFKNPAAVAPARVTAWRVVGLPAAPSFNGSALKSSYQAVDGQPFAIELDVAGTQDLTDVSGDLLFWVLRPAGFSGSPYYGPFTDALGIFQRVQLTKTPAGTLVRIEFKMAPVVGGFTFSAFKLQRLYMRTSDYSWVELELPDPNEGLVLRR